MVMKPSSVSSVGRLTYRCQSTPDPLGPSDLTADQVEERRPVMPDRQEIGVDRGRLVDAEAAHDAQRRRALQRADEAGVAVEEVWPTGPERHLPGAQEVTAAVRVQGPPEEHRSAQYSPLDFGPLRDVVEPGRDRGGEVAVDVRLPHPADL